MKRLWNRLRIAAAIAAILYAGMMCTATLVRALAYNPEREKPLPALPDTTSSAALEHSASLPARLLIPRLNINTTIQQVGITFKGNMGTPNNYTDAGWYKYGTIPGNTGSAVIDGHVDNGFGMDGVFKHLKELQPGDIIDVVMQSGETIHFTVFDMQTYYYTDLPRTAIFNRSDGQYLNLITCDGNWLSDTQTDDHRVVVYAKRTKNSAP